MKMSKFYMKGILLRWFLGKKSYFRPNLLFYVKFDQIVTTPCNSRTVLSNFFKILYKRGKEIHTNYVAGFFKKSSHQHPFFYFGNKDVGADIVSRVYPFSS